MRSDKCWPNVVLVCICKDIQPMQNYAKKKRKEKKVVAFASKFDLHYFQHNIYCYSPKNVRVVYQILKSTFNIGM